MSKVSRENKKKERRKPENWLLCESCNQIKRDVVECFCPFNEEVYNKKVLTQLCKDCYQEAVWSI
jgi:hypothetical protein